MNVTLAAEGWRFFLRRVKVAFCGVKRYSGGSDEIIRQIISDCFDQRKEYFRVSTGNFCEFYSRDFGWSVRALLEIGYKEKAVKTLEYALSVFRAHGRVEQSINPHGKPFTFPERYSPDALAFLMHSLVILGEKRLAEQHKSFLNAEIKRYFDEVIDESTGLVRKDRHYSSMKDYSIRHSSCYDNVMTAMLAADIKRLRFLDNPFKKYNYPKLIKKYFWTGEYFLDDLSGSKRICGDANILPFWSGVIKDRSMLKKAIAAIRKDGLDKPLPLRYTSGHAHCQKMILQEMLAGDYERDVVWAHMGPMFIELVAMIDKPLARRYLAEYEQKIILHKNFLEVFEKDGKPFKTLLYYTDESMLWSANHLYLKKKLLKGKSK